MLNNLRLRCWDINPTVRSKALEAIASMLQSAAVDSQWEAIIAMLTPSGYSGAVRSAAPCGSTDGTATDSSSTVVDFSLNLEEVLSHHSCDEKPIVRRCALTVIESLCDVIHQLQEEQTQNPKNEALIGFSVDVLQFVPVERLEAISCDSSIQVRQKSLACIEKLRLTNVEDTRLSRLWMSTVLPSVLDDESSVKDRAVEIVENALLQRLVAQSAKYKKQSNDNKVYY
eukprot:Lankesteria_metandrocarpae@DN6684_c0_g1_i1.p1